MKIVRKIHLWLSVPLGLFISLICLSGAMLVFEPEVTRMAQPSTYYVDAVGETPMTQEALTMIVESTLPDSVTITQVTAFDAPDRTVEFALSAPHGAKLYINPYTGKITGKSERLPFFSTMFKLHRALLGKIRPSGNEFLPGRLLVGISTIAMVVILLTGVVLWWPRLKMMGVRRSLAVPLHRGRYAFWHGLHVAGGMWSLIFVLVMALTGLTWSFKWYNTAFYALCGVPSQERVEQPRGQRGGEHHKRGQRGNASADPFSRQSSRRNDVRKAIYKVHTGQWGGIPTRILWCGTALLGATLPLTGYYIMYRRRRRRP